MQLGVHLIQVNRGVGLTGIKSGQPTSMAPSPDRGRAGELNKALIAFHFNTIIYRYDPNTHDSYGEALALAGRNEAAIKSYEQVLAFKPEDENALAQLEVLREKLEKE